VFSGYTLDIFKDLGGIYWEDFLDTICRYLMKMSADIYGII